MHFLVYQTQKKQTLLKSKKKKQIKSKKYTEHILIYDHGIDILN